MADGITKHQENRTLYLPKWIWRWLGSKPEDKIQYEDRSEKGEHIVVLKKIKNVKK